MTEIDPDQNPSTVKRIKWSSLPDDSRKDLNPIDERTPDPTKPRDPILQIQLPMPNRENRTHNYFDQKDLEISSNQQVPTPSMPIPAPGSDPKMLHDPTSVEDDVLICDTFEKYMENIEAQKFSDAPAHKQRRIIINPEM